mmetsp:Transcript_32644/g.55028  ORF Transcript_32644/g.55028 Transcript_32644/m.55028 type:complete len:169 (-) Transcript_32644:207-713(-)
MSSGVAIHTIRGALSKVLLPEQAMSLPLVGLVRSMGVITIILILITTTLFEVAVQVLPPIVLTLYSLLEMPSSELLPPPAGIGAAVVQRMLTQKPLQPPQLAYLQLQQQQSNSRHGSAAAAAADNGMGTLPLMSQRHSSKSRGDIEKLLAEAAAATIQPDTAGGLPNA